ncbi:MAG TPA: hypothetical protein DCF92_10725 [Idiomarina sp.]|nr:hypothetical protein [Idiomarina sp.]
MRYPLSVPRNQLTWPVFRLQRVSLSIAVRSFLIITAPLTSDYTKFLRQVSLSSADIAKSLLDNGDYPLATSTHYD